jgi:hypothetical protein
MKNANFTDCICNNTLNADNTEKLAALSFGATPAQNLAGAKFVNANVGGMVFAAGQNLSHADFSQATLTAHALAVGEADLSAVTEALGRGIKLQNLTKQTAATKNPFQDAAGTSQSVNVKHKVTGRMDVIGNSLDIRSINLLGYRHLENVILPSTVFLPDTIGAGIHVPRLKAGEYVNIGNFKFEANEDLNEDQLGKFVESYMADADNREIPEVTYEMTKKSS